MNDSPSRSPARLALATVLLCIAIAAAWAGWLARQSAAEDMSLKAMTLLDDPRPLPEFSLVDEHAEAIGKADLRGSWHLLFFGFTHCPAICPNTLSLLDAVISDGELQTRPPRVVLVTVDPERDSPARMRSYLAGFNPAFIGITGESADLKALRTALFVPAKRIETDTGYTMDHGSAVVVVNPQAEVAGYFTPPHQIEPMRADLGRLVNRS